MDAEKQKELRNSMLEVIHEEGLPTPERILLRKPISKVRTARRGTCRRKNIDGKDVYSIVVNITETKFVEDPNGRWVDKDGTKLKAIYGVDSDEKTIVNTAAHEIAHLRYWNHTPQHLSYTNELFDRLSKKLRWNSLGDIQ